MTTPEFREAIQRSSRKFSLQAEGVLTKRQKALDEYRKNNPHRIRQWPTKYGVVTCWGGFRMYYGTCQTCGGLVTKRRKELDKAEDMHPGRHYGRWPEYCRDECKPSYDPYGVKARKRAKRQYGIPIKQLVKAMDAEDERRHIRDVERVYDHLYGDSWRLLMLQHDLFLEHKPGLRCCRNGDTLTMTSQSII